MVKVKFSHRKLNYTLTDFVLSKSPILKNSPKTEGNVIPQCNTNHQIQGSWLGYTFLAVLNNAFESHCTVLVCGHCTWPKQLQCFTQHQELCGDVSIRTYALIVRMSMILALHKHLSSKHQLISSELMLFLIHPWQVIVLAYASFQRSSSHTFLKQSQFTQTVLIC